jgi:twinkle protein
VKTFHDFGIDLGTKSGEVKTTCPQCSPGRRKKNYPCLNVNTDKGVWNCWHCGWGGTLGTGVERRPEYTKVYRKPDFVANSTGLPQKIVDWFSHRGIGQETLKRNQIANGVAYFPQVEEERTCVQFPYFRGTECINVKYRTGDKLFRLASGAERVLYGINDIDGTLIWVEGEMDKLSMEEGGFKNCVSVPDGAPAADSKSYANKFDFLDCPELAQVQTHVIAVDNDAPGHRLEEELVRRLGREKCVVVKWPEGCKDANDVLIAHGPDVLNDCVVNAAPLPVEGVYRISSFREAIRRRYAGERPSGLSTGWPAVDKHYTVLQGEWTAVTGIPGHGKSEWLDALAVNLARHHGWSFGIYSPENSPLDYHAVKLMEKYIGKPFDKGPTERFSVADLDISETFAEDHFHFMLPERPTLECLLTQAKELVAQHGIRGLILDPWNEIEHQRGEGVTETDYISLALSKVRRFARDHGVHVWLVAHPAKLYKDKDSGQYPVPTPYDISGSAHWRNKADNCVTVYRHLLDDAKPIEIHIQKIRKKFVGRIGMVEMTYEPLSGRYREWTGYQPIYSMQTERV